MNFDHIVDPLVAEKVAIKWEEKAVEWEEAILTEKDTDMFVEIAADCRKNAAALRAQAQKLRGEK